MSQEDWLVLGLVALFGAGFMWAMLLLIIGGDGLWRKK